MNKLLLALLAAAPAFAAQPEPGPIVSDEAVQAFFEGRAFQPASAELPARRACVYALAARNEIAAKCGAEPAAADVAALSMDASRLLFASSVKNAELATGRVELPKADEDAKKAEQRGGEWYAMWGYNTERYARTDISLSQPGRGNDFTLQGVRMRDSKGWDIWNHSITVPQYSFRVGKFIKKNTAIEVNFDHAKAIVVEDQQVRMVGTLNDQPVDQVVRAGDVVSPYKLNNGANFALFNVVQRLPLVREPGQVGSIAALARAGVGFMLPHTENTVYGEPNQPGFQYGGLGAGVEAAVRAYVAPHVFLEASQKYFHGRYRNLNIKDGKAQQNLNAHVTVISAGVSF